MMRAENGKLHSHLESPKYVFSIFHIQGSQVGGQVVDDRLKFVDIHIWPSYIFIAIFQIHAYAYGLYIYMHYE